MKHVATILIEQADGSVVKETREFGGFKRDLVDLVAWFATEGIENAVMESTGVYWKSVYAALEAAGIPALVVNARHARNVPGRKTDVADSEWLASLGRFGLLRGSFIAPKDLRELRLVSRYRTKVTRMLAAEKNRLHKVLDDAGIKLGGVVSDINGASARAMIAGLMAGEDPDELVRLAQGRLCSKREALRASLDGSLSARHRLILTRIGGHLRMLEAEIAVLDAELLAAMEPYAWAHRLLQTIPGLDEIAAAQVLIEIGEDMTRFGSAQRLASWAALCPGNDESAGKRRSGKTRKGSQMVRTLLVEVANSARRTKSAFRAKYEALVIRRGHKRTIVALAHKLLRTIFVVLSRREPYRDPGIDYEALTVAKNAPRWIKALKKFGYWPVAAST
jgi:transposase